MLAVAGACLLPGLLWAAPPNFDVGIQQMRYGDAVASQRNKKAILPIGRTSLKAPFARQQSEGLCGNSAPDPGEECDDGNTMNGDGCSAQCKIETGFDCSDAIPGQDTQNAVGDGSFELDDGSWDIDGWFAGLCDASCTGGQNFASDGSNWVWIGGLADTPDAGSATQTFVIPNSATDLSFDVFSAASGCGDSTVAVDIDGNQLWRYEDQGNGECKTTEPFEYEPVTVDVSAFADGNPHTLTLTGDYVPGGGGQVASWFLDNFQVSVPRIPPVPPVPSACAPIVCGDGLLGRTESCDDGNAISGDGCSSVCLVEQPDYFCDAPLPPAPSGNDVQDGSLELGFPNYYWKQSGTVFDPIGSGATFGANLGSDGALFAWFGGTTVPNNQTIEQDLTISATATDLTFDLLVGICDSADDSLTIEIDGNEVYRYDCTADTARYVIQTVPLNAFADGGFHTLTFIGNTVATNGGNSNFFVDNIAIKDNTPFAGKPGSCWALPPACGPVEQFNAGIPAGWTVINLGTDASDGWGASNDGICGTGNWTPNNGFNNQTGGEGLSACSDSDAVAQADTDAGGTPGTVDSFLCLPELDLRDTVNPIVAFRANYQAVTNLANDNGTPSDPSDDFDDDLLFVFVGTQAPSALTLAGYTPVLNVFDHLDQTLALSPPGVYRADLSAIEQADSAYVCFRYRATNGWFGQVDNVAVRAPSCALTADPDGDGIGNETDNCTLVANPTQVDSDLDGYGNACDADLNNDCVVSPIDLGLHKLNFFSQPRPEVGVADANADGFVNFSDIGILKEAFFNPPGPSASETCR